jgi:hypothetical protein
MCEGWSLEIGTAFRGSVVRQDRIETTPTWLASVNSTYLSEHPDRESAIARVQADKVAISLVRSQPQAALNTDLPIRRRRLT